MIEQANRVVSAAETRLKRSTPEAQGASSSVLFKFYRTLDVEVHDIHSAMVLRHGAVISEAWWTPYAPDLSHMMFSLSKSFTSTAVGLAISDGLLSLDDTVLGFFPDEAPAVPSKNLVALRIRDLLTMTTGNAEDTLSALFRNSNNNWVEAFLNSDFVYFPGTQFVYNSGATYMLSAILQKLTGKRLLDYLEPRLLGPLGIAGATWETSPQGINTGGWGLTLTTEDIAKFGQFYLQRGVWNGQRILPDAWVREATSKQVPNGDNPESDWAQGYGFQFWQSRHGAYRGDGACGQFCIVIPDQDVVIAMTAGTNDLQAVLEIVWQTLLPALEADALPEDAAAREEFAALVSRFEVHHPEGFVSTPIAEAISGKTFALEPNENGLTELALSGDGREAILRVTDPFGTHTFRIGLDGVWISGETALNVPGYPMAAGQAREMVATGAWTNDVTFRAKLCFLKTPFAANLKLRFEDNSVFLNIHANAGFGPMEWSQITGTVVPPA